MAAMAFPEPTHDELAAMNTIDDVADWAELGHRPHGEEAPMSPRGSLYEAIGVVGTNKPRMMAAIPEADIASAVSNWTIGGKPPNAALRACAGMMGAACRLAAGVARTRPAVAAEVAEFNARKIKEMELQTRLAEATAVGSNGTGVNSNSKVKLCTVVDQANDTEVAKLPKQIVDACYDKYKSIYGDVPCPEEDVTADQLAALHDLFKSDGIPYVDLAIWGPFGRRLQKKLQLCGMVMQADGSFQNVRLYGPPCIEEWVRGFNVFKTGAIMLNAISHATLDNYMKHIVNFARLYGPKVWALIYQADVRARLEHVERIRRRGQVEADTAKAANGVHPFDASKPWDWSYKALTEDFRFWKRELEDQAVLILAHIEVLDHSLEGDAEVERLTYKKAPPAAGERGGVQQGAEPPKKKQRNIKHTERQHIQDSSGLMSANRNGTPLCDKFQLGSCKPAIRGNRCPDNLDLVHQCASCLSQKHGSQFPNKCGDVTNKPTGKGKGKGKGKKQGKHQR